MSDLSGPTRSPQRPCFVPTQKRPYTPEEQDADGQWNRPDGAPGRSIDAVKRVPDSTEGRGSPRWWAAALVGGASK
eukprot:3912163-Pyramimonas_sp.AAC.1